MFDFVYKTSRSCAVVFMGTLIGLACIAVPRTRHTYAKGPKISRMSFLCNSEMNKCLAFFLVLYALYMAFALECPAGKYTATGAPTEFPTTSAIIPKGPEPNGWFQLESQKANYVETWSDNGYIVRAKANVAQWFGINAGLFDGLNSDTGLALYFYTFYLFNSGGVFLDANLKFQGDAGVTSFIDIGRAITPESMTLAARITTSGNQVDFAPGRFEVYGSNNAADWNSTNSSTWILLFAQTTTTTYPSQLRTFAISTSTAYQYYALHITHTMGERACFFFRVGYYWDFLTVSRVPSGIDFLPSQHTVV